MEAYKKKYPNAIVKKRKTKKGSSESEGENWYEGKDTPPKKALTGYTRFANEKRAGISEANPDLPFGQISKKVGEAWNALGDAGKKPYNDLYEADKTKYATVSISKLNFRLIY